LIKAKALFQQHNVRAGGASGLTLRDVIRAAQRAASVDGDDDIVCLFVCLFGWLFIVYVGVDLKLARSEARRVCERTSHYICHFYFV
jgi:hypothetical protein